MVAFNTGPNTLSYLNNGTKCNRELLETIGILLTYLQRKVHIDIGDISQIQKKNSLDQCKFGLVPINGCLNTISKQKVFSV